MFKVAARLVTLLVHIFPPAVAAAAATIFCAAIATASGVVVFMGTAIPANNLFCNLLLPLSWSFSVILYAKKPKGKSAGRYWISAILWQWLPFQTTTTGHTWLTASLATFQRVCDVPLRMTPLCSTLLCSLGRSTSGTGSPYVDIAGEMTEYVFILSFWPFVALMFLHNVIFGPQSAKTDPGVKNFKIVFFGTKQFFGSCT